MKKGLLLLLLLAGLLVLSGGLVAQDMPDAIEVGAVIPLTGPFAGGGAQVERGYQMAIDKINEAGGVQVGDVQLPINLTVIDDESDPAKTVSALEELNEQGVVAYLGGFGSSLHAAAAAIAEKNGVPYLGVAFALWDVHQQGYQYLFSPFPKSPDLAVATFDLLDTIDEDIRPTRIGIVQPATDWGIEMAGFWTEEAEARGGYEIVLHEEYNNGNQDFTDIILAAQEADVEILLALPIPPDGVTLFKQMGEQNWSPDFAFVIRAPDVPTWMENLGEVGDYVLLAPGWANAVTFPGVEELNAAHMDMMDRPADPMVGPSFAAIQILVNAIEDAGSLDRDAIRDAIAATELETVVGDVTFNDDGTGNVVVPMLQYQQGKIELVYPLEMATADMVFPAPPFDERGM